MIDIQPSGQGYDYILICDVCGENAVFTTVEELLQDRDTEWDRRFVNWRWGDLCPCCQVMMDEAKANYVIERNREIEAARAILREGN